MFLVATHCLIMILICAKLFSNPTMHNKVIHNFDLAKWFLFTTQFVMLIICAKSFSNITMHNKVMGRTWTGSTEVYAQSLSVDCGLDL